MADTRGVFRLKFASSLKSKGEWVPLDQVWSSPSKSTIGAFDTGYFAGGTPTSGKSTVDKMDFSTDTTTYTPGANLNVARYALGGVGSKTSGYTGGGSSSPNPLSTVEKTSFADDTTANVPGAALSEARYSLNAAGGSNAGYFGGGVNPGGNNSKVDKVTYSSDTTARAPGADLTQATIDLAAVGNETATYFSGGSGPKNSITTKLTYSSDTTARAPGADLSVARYEMGGGAGNLTAGYISGGQSPNESRTDKITYSTDTAARVPGADLPAAQIGMTVTGNRSAGYYGGGGNSTNAFMKKLTFSSETFSSLPSGSNLSVARASGGGFSSRENGLGGAPSNPATRFTDNALQTPNAGYFGGGNPGPTSKIDKLSFSTETTARIPGANLSAGRKYLAAAGGTTQGYFAGGHQPPKHSTTDKLTYTTDTAAYTPTANLHIARRDVAGTGNLVAGYFVGGEQPSPGSGQTYVDKCIYATDITARIPSCNIGSPYPSDTTQDTAKQKQGCGNVDVSFFNGGPGERSFADKITYATDTAATTPSAFLVVGRVAHAAGGNGDAGYFAGGYSNPNLESRVEKTTYSNDTTTAVPSADLTSTKYHFAGASNENAVYWAGGIGGVTNKMTFATETTAASPGANLSVYTYGHAAVSSRMNGFPGADPPTPTPSATTFPIPASTPNTGYIGGGKNPSRTSSTEKISYASETTGRIPGADLSVARDVLGAIGTPSVGYFCGGSGVEGDTSIVDKTTYASDTTARVPGANLTIAGEHDAVMGNTTQGYLNHGNYPSHSNMMKVTYSTETTETLPSTADLSVPARNNMSISNTDHGYTAGGRDQPGPPSTYLTNVDKTVFSTDTTSRIPGANLAFPRQSGGTTGDSTTGYFGAGEVQGQPNTDTSTVEKITYSSDTRANVPSSANLSAPGRDLAATGNTTAGYFIGGKVNPGGGSFPLTSKVDRLTYATETRATVPGAKLDAARGEGGQNATGARANGRSDSIGVPTPNIV